MAVCRKCKKEIGGFFGAKKALPVTINEAEKRGIDPTGLCDDCLQNEVDSGPSIEAVLEARNEAERLRVLEVKADELAAKRKAEELIEGKRRDLEKIVISTSPHPAEWTHEIVGIVNGFSVIGTGPLAEVFSSVTDFFGTESKAYHEKLTLAKNKAIARAKEEAYLLRANMIFGLQVNITEISSSHGMLMFAVTGTALKHEEK